MQLDQYDLDQLALYNVTDKKLIFQHLLKSYDEFIDGLPEIIQSQFVQELSYTYSPPVNGIHKVEYGLNFTDVVIDTPTTSKRGRICPLYPNETRIDNTTYQAPIYATVNLWTIKYRDPSGNGKLVADKKVEHNIANQPLGSIPVMVKSKICQLYNKPDNVLLALGEDPFELGGHFIIKGSAKVMYSRKNNVKNIPLFSRDQAGIIRCKFSSQMGDYYEQSKFLVMHLYPNNLLLVELNIKKDSIIFPFYILYYLFETATDEEIFDTVLPNYNPKIKDHIMIASQFHESMKQDYTTLKTSISETYGFENYKSINVNDPMELVLVIAEILNKNDSTLMLDSGYKFSNLKEKHTTFKKINELFNHTVFPHIGITSNDRKNKLNSIGSLINKMYRIANGDKVTDRNSLENVAVYNPAPTLVGSFKSIFNYTVATNIISGITKKIRKGPDVDTKTIYNKSHKPDTLCEVLSKTLSSGNNPEITIKQGRDVKNRTSAVQKDYTNRGTEVCIGHSITVDPNVVGGKSNDVVVQKKSVHPSEQGVKCVIQSIEGADTGNVGQMSLMCEITSGINSNPLIEMLKQEVEEFDKLNEKNNTYSQVFVNGKALGTHHDTRILARKYRLKRRAGEIHPHISVSYNPLDNGDLHFYSNMSRLIRPLVIVYQNREPHEDKYNSWPAKPHFEYDAPKDFQYILFTKRHAELLYNKQITLQDLVNEGVIEYIAPNENMNIIACASLAEFEARKNDRTNDYTHMSIPIGDLSLSILSGTFPHCTQPVRCVYHSKFVKQALAFPAVNYHVNYHKKLPVRYNIYKPLVQTVVDKVYNYGATSILVAVLADADNQEDSISVSESLAYHDKYTIDLFNSTSVELSSDQILETPDLTVNGIKSSDFSHLINGLPKRGTVITKGMAIIGIVENKVIRGETPMIIKTDRSIYHKSSNTITIDNAGISHKSSTKIVKVGYKVSIPIEQGDKFGAESGCKGVISNVKPDNLMPTLANGLTPEMCINPASFPSRMASGQILEGHLGEMCARVGAFADATFFKSFDKEKLEKLAKELNMDYSGVHVLYDGKTGKRMKAHIGVLHNGYERLNKLSKNNSSVTENPNINFITQQPEKGINKGGGQRFGYMEIDVLAAHGATKVMNDILFNDSDAKYVYICDTCHTIAAVNPKKNIYTCKGCNLASFSRIKTTHATAQIIHNLSSFGVKANIIPGGFLN
ncbi:MAG: hypothetical protein CMM93_04170 [Rickettsiales bacterium]|nr:hypothetical protein [Rickettsiales bacterium]